MCQVFVDALAWRIVLCLLFESKDISAYSTAADEGLAYASDAHSREIEIGSSTLSLRSAGKAVMRREDLSRSTDSASGAESDAEGVESGIEDPFDVENVGRDPDACRNVFCTPNKAKRMGDQVPEVCKKGNLCTEEECCFGMCIDMPGQSSCPIGAIPKPKAITPPACKGSECTFGECCLGYCQKENCPVETSVFRNESDRPAHCSGYPCEPEECCFGTCAGMQCPKGSMEKDREHQPAWCEGFPCKVEECCHPVCEQDLCSQQGEEANNIFYKLLRNFTGNQTAADFCAGVPCKPEECCVGTCRETVCTKATPPKPESVWPPHCKGWECEGQECCEGRCSELFCEHHGSEMRLDVTAETECAAEPCTPLECCAGTCAAGSCPQDFGIKLKPNAPEHCSGLQCTTEECCNSFCTEVDCPSSKGLSLKETPSTECAAAVCTEIECCDNVLSR